MKEQRINFRVTGAEKEQIEKNARQVNMTVSSYAAHAALNKQIILIEGMDEMAYQLNKIGTNLNQLTKKSNEGILRCIDLTETKEEISKIYECLIALGKQGYPHGNR